jgi:hypothetical protein
MTPICRAKLQVAFSVLFTPIGAVAQEPDPSRESLYQQLFPRPTGENGYEELLRAGELLKKSERFKRAQGQPAEGEKPQELTLAVRREILGEPDVQRALAQMRAGLNKPLTAPQSDTDAALSAYGAYRQLGRLLAMELYVRMADGREELAIESARDGLRLGYAIQSDKLLGGLAGAAINSLVSSALTAHVEELSLPACRKLSQLVRAWMDAPDPAIAALTQERDLILKNLDKQLPAGEGFPRAQILALVKGQVNYMIENLRKPHWERRPIPPIGGDEVAAQYVEALQLDKVLGQVGSSFARDQARMQMLGVRAVLRAYRWEFGCLPNSLDELQLGRLITDPFTGKSLVYRRTGALTYELSSAGFDQLPR